MVAWRAWRPRGVKTEACYRAYCVVKTFERGSCLEKTECSYEDRREVLVLQRREEYSQSKEPKAEINVTLKTGVQASLCYCACRRLGGGASLCYSLLCEHVDITSYLPFDNSTCCQWYCK